MIANIGSVYKDKDLYKFICHTDDKAKGYESKTKKKAQQARAKLMRILQDNGFKIHQPS